MTLIDRHGPCIGLRLFKSKKRFIQLWYCPRNYQVESHSHNDQNIELMYLFGKTTFHRVKDEVTGAGTFFETHYPLVESFTPRWYHIFTRFTVRCAQVHWFSVSYLPLIFVNFAIFIDGKEPTSAAIDFHPTTK